MRLYCWLQALLLLSSWTLEQHARFYAFGFDNTFLKFLDHYSSEALAASGTKSACSSGPYLYDNSCSIVNQGIGSSMNRMKYIVVLAQAYNLSIIPNPECFHSQEHHTDMFDYFGWSLATDCTLKELQTALTVEKGQPVPQASEFLLRVIVTKFDLSVQKNNNKNKDNAMIEKVCRAMHSRQDYASLARGFTSEDADTNDLFPAMNREIARVGSVKNVVFQINNRYMMEGYLCATEFIEQQWRRRKEREKRASSFDFDKVNIAFHLRHGDVATKSVNFVNIYGLVRTITLEQGIKVLQQVLGPKSILHKNEAVTVNFYSEGNLAEFADLTKAFPQTRYFLGNASTIHRDMDDMANADILLASPSSFTSLVASLNKDAIILVDKENPEKFEGIDNSVAQADILQGKLGSFNKMFCSQKLHTRQHDKLCGVEQEPKQDARDGRMWKVHQHHDHAAHDDLHMEIKRLRLTLTDVNKEFNLEAIQNDLYSNSQLFKYFANQSHNVVCLRKPGVSSEKVYHPTICDEKGPQKLSKSSTGMTPNLHLSYFLRTVAASIVDRGYQIPTFIVHGPNERRRERLQKNLNLSGIKDSHVTWRGDFLANNISDADRTHFGTGKDAYYNCKEVLGDRPCRNGYAFSNMEMSVALKHVAIIRSIAEAAKKGAAKSKSVLQKYSLVIEDDQFLPKEILRQIVEVLLQTPEHLGLVMLDDSFFFNGAFSPPENLLKYPFPLTYERNETRTVGAYLLSDAAAVQLADGKDFLPLYSPVDHQLQFALKKSSILTHWMFPPMTCAGSQGLELGSSSTGGITMDPGDRLGCRTCCNRFYNTTNMEDIYTIAVRPHL